MFTKIMVPVDLSHQDHLGRALQAASDLAKHYDAALVFVGVTPSTPSSVAHSPEEYRGKLEKFANDQGAAAGVAASAYTIVAPDPSVEMNRALLRAVAETGADLVVMQSHIPNVMDYVWASHGGYVADHAKVSVMLIR